MTSPINLPAQGSPQWYRAVEQKIEQQQAEIDRLWKQINQRDQTGNSPVAPDVEVP